MQAPAEIVREEEEDDLWEQELSRYSLPRDEVDALRRNRKARDAFLIGYYDQITSQQQSQPPHLDHSMSTEEFVRQGLHLSVAQKGRWLESAPNRNALVQRLAETPFADTAAYRAISSEASEYGHLVEQQSKLADAHLTLLSVDVGRIPPDLFERRGREVTPTQVRRCLDLASQRLVPASWLSLYEPADIAALHDRYDALDADPHLDVSAKAARRLALLVEFDEAQAAKASAQDRATIAEAQRAGYEMLRRTVTAMAADEKDAGRLAALAQLMNERTYEQAAATPKTQRLQQIMDAAGMTPLALDAAVQQSSGSIFQRAKGAALKYAVPLALLGTKVAHAVQTQDWSPVASYLATLALFNGVDAAMTAFNRYVTANAGDNAAVRANLLAGNSPAHVDSLRVTLAAMGLDSLATGYGSAMDAYRDSGAAQIASSMVVLALGTAFQSQLTDAARALTANATATLGTMLVGEQFATRFRDLVIGGVFARLDGWGLSALRCGLTARYRSNPLVRKLGPYADGLLMLWWSAFGGRHRATRASMAGVEWLRSFAPAIEEQEAQTLWSMTSEHLDAPETLVEIAADETVLPSGDTMSAVIEQHLCEPVASEPASGDARVASTVSETVAAAAVGASAMFPAPVVPTAAAAAASVVPETCVREAVLNWPQVTSPLWTQTPAPVCGASTSPLLRDAFSSLAGTQAGTAAEMCTASSPYSFVPAAEAVTAVANMAPGDVAEVASSDVLFPSEAPVAAEESAPALAAATIAATQDSGWGSMSWLWQALIFGASAAVAVEKVRSRGE